MNHPILRGLWHFSKIVLSAILAGAALIGLIVLLIAIFHPNIKLTVPGLLEQNQLAVSYLDVAQRVVSILAGIGGIVAAVRYRQQALTLQRQVIVLEHQLAEQARLLVEKDAELTRLKALTI